MGFIALRACDAHLALFGQQWRSGAMGILERATTAPALHCVRAAMPISPFLACNGAMSILARATTAPALHCVRAMPISPFLACDGAMHEHLSTRGYSSWTSLTAPRALNHLPRGQGSLAHRAGRRASSGDSGFSQCGGASVGDAHPAARTNERRFLPPSARDLPARRACRQAGRQTKSTPLAPTTTQLHQHIHTRAPPSLQWFTLTFRREA